MVPLLIALMVSTACGGATSDADIDATIEATKIANINITHAIATIESEYNSSLNTAFAEGIYSLNQALNSYQSVSFYC